MKRYLVIPEEREDFFTRKLEEPLIKENVNEFNWKFIYYDALKTYFESGDWKKNFVLSEFEGLSETSNLKTRKQQTMHEYL